MGRGLFITGTDTGVGKTVVAATLLVGLQEAGLRMAALKPVETGCGARDGRPVPADAEYLRAVGRLAEPLEAMAPYAFALPASPLAAARQAGAAISLDRIAEAYTALAGAADCVLVEGAGGLLVPLAEGVQFPQVARRLRIPVLLVARTALGTLNHTQLTVREAGRAGLEVIGIVLNDGRAVPGVADEANLALLSELAGAPILGRVPLLPGSPPARETLAAAARAHIKLDILRAALGV
ncbi:MAG TPA: dethiobiotin synthase [Candidatus Sulfotelmatobacter sp.]|nr:dethiobiotin synthase [Candidatus Sulfotelmatobacter sp.]